MFNSVISVCKACCYVSFRLYEALMSLFDCLNCLIPCSICSCYDLSSRHIDREVVFQCRDEGPLRARVRWLRGNGLPLPPGSRDVNGRLEMPDIQVYELMLCILYFVFCIFCTCGQALLVVSLLLLIPPRISC
jgi:hypothetical protein